MAGPEDDTKATTELDKIERKIGLDAEDLESALNTLLDIME